MKKILMSCVVMTLLVVARCIATAVRELYYGRTAWMNVILQDSWFYVGIVTAAMAILCGTVLLSHRRKK